jgi:CRISPR-associated protein Csd1
MAWMQKLYETYERCAGSSLPDANALLPIAHTTQQAHIEIVIDDRGNFRRARLIDKNEPDRDCVVPATEDSASRSSNEAPHALCDKLQYCAADYAAFGGTKKAYFTSYEGQLARWCQSPYTHPKASAILAYVRKNRIIADLAGANVVAEKDGKLVVYERPNDKATARKTEVAPIFKLLAAKKVGNRTIIDQGDAFVRWRVETANEVATGTWEDASLARSWQDFYASEQSLVGMCQVTGRIASLATKHPKGLRSSKDGAKLISSNDDEGFTYRGRFHDASQAVGVSFEVSQKAHKALHWLIKRKQAFHNSGQVFVSWSPAGQAIPDLWANTMSLLSDDQPQGTPVLETTSAQVDDVGQGFSLRLQRAMAGYRSNLADTDGVVVMGLDSAMPDKGGLAIIFYRELKGSEFLDRIHSWHEGLAWRQNFGRQLKFIGAPSPMDIAQVAYGRRQGGGGSNPKTSTGYGADSATDSANLKVEEKVGKAISQRLLPCIIDGVPLPADLVMACCRRASNRSAFKRLKSGAEPDWEKCLGVACALYKGFHSERKYSMALEEDRKTRDYLYGRLLAIAEEIERMALLVADENRDTTAARLMQRFADRPYSTWRTIELALSPYRSRLRSSRAGFLWNKEKLLDQVLGAFSPQDEKEAFINDRPLAGEFLLGYHCQRQQFRHAPEDTDPTSVATE